MRKILSVIAFTVMLAPGLALAGAADNEPGTPMDRLAEQLGLSDEQQSEIESIIQKQREKQMTLQQETQEQINAVLTDEQRAQLEEMQKQREEEMRRRMEEMRKQQGNPEQAPAQ